MRSVNFWQEWSNPPHKLGEGELLGFPSFVGLITLLNIVLLFWHVPWLVHDSWHIQDLFWRA